MSLERTEKECAAAATEPRVSLNDIEAAISNRYHFTADDAVISLGMPAVPALSVLSICLLVMHNGFTIIGKSAPASPANFNAELGKKLAYEDAVRQLWPLMGFALRGELHSQASGAGSTGSSPPTTPYHDPKPFGVAAPDGGPVVPPPTTRD